MKFDIDQAVKTKIDPNFGGMDGKGVVVSIQKDHTRQGGRLYTVQHGNGHCYNYKESQLSEIKTKTLFAYKDATDEVHWSTRKYDSKERVSFGFQEAFDFNKTIELE